MGSALSVAASVALTLIVLATGGPETASGSSSGFSPSTIKGKWIGEWKNTTFNTTGTIRANIKELAGNKMGVLVDFGGSVFGCNDPAPVSVTLPKHTGANGWSSKGFNVSKQTQAFGNLKLTYSSASGSISGSGSAPPCNPNITYTVKGKLTSSKFNATVSINLGGGQTATSVLTAKKH
jgi:hypothetical protein